MPLPNCLLGPRCGDGIAQEAYGEECEPTSSSDPNCTQACKKPGVCGDGVVTPPEQCDYGTTNNDGSYRGCAPSGILAPHCGDGVNNGPTDGCSATCKLNVT